MKVIKYSSQFKKDFKRYHNNKSKVEKLLEVVCMLENGIKLPAKHRLHKLSGNYKDCWECHIDGDFLLIWMDETLQVVKLIRLGSHSELF